MLGPFRWASLSVGLFCTFRCHFPFLKAFSSVCPLPVPCGQLYMTDPRCAELSSLETNLYTECRQHAIEFTVRQQHVNTHPLNLCVCVALSAGPRTHCLD